MSVLVSARSVEVNLGGRAVLADADLIVNQGDKLALVGHNGSGKTTLLNVLAGDQEIDGGVVERRRGLQVGRVEQFLPTELQETPLVDAIAGERWQVEALLTQLAFSPVDFDIPVAGLSGGQQNRLMFARAVIRAPDLLLLDEPTNHLDLATILLFEQMLTGMRSALVLISHDRAFLDSVCDVTAFVDGGRIRRFDLPYSDAVDARDAQNKAAQATLETEERQIRKLRASAKRLAIWGRQHDNEKFSRRAKSMERRAAKLEEEKTEVAQASRLDLDLALGSSRAKQALVVTDFTVTIANRDLFAVQELIIKPGDRVALLGANGVGKTTFIDRLVQCHQQVQESAHLRFNPQTSLGYYDQELDETASSEEMVAFVTQRVSQGDQAVRQRLIGAGFEFARHNQRMCDLSGGERARVLFVVLSMSAPNFLVLDEPTNHIDIAGKQQLESTLLDAQATLLVTSHDREFLETVSDRFLWIHDGKIEEINTPDAFYASLLRQSSQPLPEQQEVEDPLDKIEALETLLAKDLAQKPKYQKPQRQAAWRAEIERLYEGLE